MHFRIGPHSASMKKCLSLIKIMLYEEKLDKISSIIHLVCDSSPEVKVIVMKRMH